MKNLQNYYLIDILYIGGKIVCSHDGNFIYSMNNMKVVIYDINEDSVYKTITHVNII
jgi:hypothetical protein